MPHTRRSVLIGLPVLAALPAAAIAEPHDPLLTLILEWRRIGDLIGETPPGAETDPDLIARWEEAEHAMLGVRPTTVAGALAAWRLVADDLWGFDVDEQWRWLAHAGSEFMEAQE